MLRKHNTLVATIILGSIILLLVCSISLPGRAHDDRDSSGPYLALALKAPLTPSLTPTITSTPTFTSTPSYGIILISEVMVQPDSLEPDGEWIELYNSGGGTINLSTYKIGDEETRGSGGGHAPIPRQSQPGARPGDHRRQQCRQFPCHLWILP